MGFLDGLLGRRRPAKPNLDALFSVPNAAITLQVASDLLPTGKGAVAFRPVEGRAFADIEADIRALLDADGGPPVEVVSDGFGYTWIVVSTDPPDVGAVVTDVHAVNATLADHGFGPQLLCSLIPFRGPDGHTVALVYLFKRGTFYPFAPREGEQRDSITELQIRDLLQGELPWDADTSRWFALWGAPGLDEGS
jgi:hypothetical protein